MSVNDRPTETLALNLIQLALDGQPHDERALKWIVEIVRATGRRVEPARKEATQ